MADAKTLLTELSAAITEAEANTTYVGVRFPGGATVTYRDPSGALAPGDLVVAIVSGQESVGRVVSDITAAFDPAIPVVVALLERVPLG